MPADKNDQQQNKGKERNSQNQTANTENALKQAEKDISNDPDLSNEPDPAADLDEGELATLEGEE